MEEEKKLNYNPFSRIKKQGPFNEVPDIAMAEWEAVKTEADAKKWHIKWTPWFTNDMIDGIVKYGYSCK